MLGFAFFNISKCQSSPSSGWWQYLSWILDMPKWTLLLDLSPGEAVFNQARGLNYWIVLGVAFHSILLPDLRNERCFQINGCHVGRRRCSLFIQFFAILEDDVLSDIFISVMFSIFLFMICQTCVRSFFTLSLKQQMNETKPIMNISMKILIYHTTDLTNVPPQPSGNEILHKLDLVGGYEI